MNKAELKALGEKVAGERDKTAEGSPARRMLQQVCAGIDATLHATPGDRDPNPVNCRQIEAQLKIARGAPSKKSAPKKSGGKKNGKKAGGKKTRKR